MNVIKEEEQNRLPEILIRPQKSPRRVMHVNKDDLFSVVNSISKNLSTEPFIKGF